MTTQTAQSTARKRGGDLLKGRKALVTGGTRGIGAAVVTAFLDEGAEVLFSGRTMASVHRAETVFEGRARGVVADLEQASAAEELADSAFSTLGGQVDILVNNAGVASTMSAWDVTISEWERVQSVNVTATFFLSRAVAKGMCRRGSGSIVNLSSIAGQNGGMAGNPAYATAKAAVIGLTRSLARRLGPQGVRVNCIAPADIETDMTAGWPAELRERLIAITPLGRFGQPREVAEAAVFLASDAASFMTGQTIAINGGAFMN
jgi:3-oxoacyl-[acyl-carrier protein] reductase